MTNANLPRIDGTLALQVDFGDEPAPAFHAARPGKAWSHRALPPVSYRPDKYIALEHRRRQAQIAARKALGLI